MLLLFAKTTEKVLAGRNQRVENPPAAVLAKALEQLTTRRRLVGLLSFRLFQRSTRKASLQPPGTAAGVTV
jgi:hypothetical protein